MISDLWVIRLEKCSVVKSFNDIIMLLFIDLYEKRCVSVNLWFILIMCLQFYVEYKINGPVFY